MHQIFTSILFLITLLAAGPAMSQGLGLGVHVGPKAGLAFSLLDGQLNAKTFYKTGFSGGLMLRIRSDKSFAFQPELLYTQQGTGSGLSSGSTNPDYKLNFGCVNLPIMMKVYVGKVFNFQLGPQVGLIVSAQKVGQIGTSSSGAAITVDQDVMADYYPLNFALNGGIGVDLPNGLVASARLCYGFSDINNNAADQKIRDALGIGGIHNRGFEFAVGYLIGANK